jgi:imidazolonepropionase-like amidohydrolase
MEIALPGVVWLRPRSWAALLLAGLVTVAGPVAASDLALVDVRVVPSPRAEIIEDAVVWIADGRIRAVGPAQSVAVPASVPRLSLAGGTVLAGYWNSHVHLLEPPYRHSRQSNAQVLEQALAQHYGRWGFTTVVDLASLDDDGLDLSRRTLDGQVRGPRVLSVGAPFYPAGGTPIYVRELYAQAGNPDHEVATARAAQQRVRAQLSQGAVAIKLFTGAIVGGAEGVRPMSVEVADAAAEAAHRGGVRVFAHATDGPSLEVALAAGVDALAHVTPDMGPWDEAMVKRLVDAGVWLVPSLAMFEHELQREGAPEAVQERFRQAGAQQVGALVDAGGQILFGTDAGYADVYDTGRELQLLAQAGLDWRQILASLTTAPAAFFAQEAERGTVAAGMRADLVVLRSDPAQSVAALADVALVLRDGQVIYRRETKAVAAAQAEAPPRRIAMEHVLTREMRSVHRSGPVRLDGQAVHLQAELPERYTVLKEHQAGRNQVRLRLQLAGDAGPVDGLPRYEVYLRVAGRERAWLGSLDLARPADWACGDQAGRDSPGLAACYEHEFARGAPGLTVELEPAANSAEAADPAIGLSGVCLELQALAPR